VSCPRNGRYFVAMKMSRRGETCRRFGVSACGRMKSVIIFVETSLS
jgi:hypothetical protein